MLKSPISNVLKVKEQVSSPSVVVGSHTSQGSRSCAKRRRPTILSPSEISAIHIAKIDSLNKHFELAVMERKENEEIYKIKLEIEKERLQIEKEKVKQEKIKTKLLEIDLANKLNADL